MLQSDKVRIGHIIEACELLLENSSDSRRREIDLDVLLSQGIVKLLENIGEASKNLSSELRDSLPQVKWKDFIRTRDRLSHGYFNIDMDRVWDIVLVEVPLLRRALLDRFPDITSKP